MEKVERNGGGRRGTKEPEEAEGPADERTEGQKDRRTDQADRHRERSHGYEGMPHHHHRLHCSRTHQWYFWLLYLSPLPLKSNPSQASISYGSETSLFLSSGSTSTTLQRSVRSAPALWLRTASR